MRTKTKPIPSFAPMDHRTAHIPFPSFGTPAEATRLESPLLEHFFRRSQRFDSKLAA